MVLTTWPWRRADRSCGPHVVLREAREWGERGILLAARTHRLHRAEVIGAVIAHPVIDDDDPASARHSRSPVRDSRPAPGIEPSGSNALRGNEHRGIGDKVASIPDLAGISDGGIDGGAVAHRRLGRQIVKLGQGEGSASDVLRQGNARFVIGTVYADLAVD